VRPLRMAPITAPVSFTPEGNCQGQSLLNFDLRPLESEDLSGLSVFCKDAKGDMFHTYSTYAATRLGDSTCGATKNAAGAVSRIGR
jgi:predicted dithiol-disulfide oxidoreductase (DUF899 family)